MELGRAFVGDGAMQMNGMNELITIAKYWRRWQDPRLIIIVLNNRDLNMVTWEMRAMAGEPKFPASQEVPNFPYGSMAATVGLTGYTVDKAENVPGVLEAALAADRPVVIDAVVDPDVPMLPPHVTWEQAKNYVKALMKGDPDSRGILRQSIKQMFAPWG